MRTPSTGKAMIAAGIAMILLGLVPGAARAQEGCRGDVNDDGTVTTADAVALLPILFGSQTDAATEARADANDDGVVTGADIIAILQLDGFPCPGPTKTPTASPTPTPPLPPTSTSTATPTRTLSPTQTPSPTPQCIIQQAQFGTTTGQITGTDCRRMVFGASRLGDAYAITGPVGSSVKIEVTGDASLVPFLVLLDSDGQFDIAQGLSPIQFVIASTQPYDLFITTLSPAGVGSYTLKLTSIPCPTPVAIQLGTSSGRQSIDATDCPDPGFPSVGTQTNPVDTYTFTVSTVPTNVSITMQQLNQDDDLFPTFSVLGPDGFEIITQDETFDCSGDILFCSNARFLALQAGTYTIIASGDGGTGSYALTVASPTCNAKALTDIPTNHPLNCPGSTLGCMGTLSGSTSVTRCAAPAPNIEDDVPEPSSPADLYTFTANAGDVISVEMMSDDDPHVYLYGPAPTNTLIAEDTDNGAELAATLTTPGTYTIVAANNAALYPAEFGDPAETVDYTLFIQKCPIGGSLNPSTARVVQGTFSTVDCVGFGGIPFHSYQFNGTAGQFVTTTVTAPNADAFVRLIAPDGSRVENDDDLFELSSTDARVNRILPATGTYFVEVSTSPGLPVALTPPVPFLVQAKSCSTTVASPGQISGSWQDGDCELTGGRKVDVYTLPTAAPSGVASIMAPSNGCVVALLAEGGQTPTDGCNPGLTDAPLLSNKTYGFMVAGADPTTRGAYSGQLARCPLTTTGFGTTRTGTLTAGSCTDALGAGADWYFIQGLSQLVQFNFGISGRVTASFPVATLQTDTESGFPVSGLFSEDPELMFSSAGNLGFLLKIAGATPADHGTYMLSVDPAFLRQ